MEVRRITAAQTIPLRWQVLRSGLPRESAIFAGDDIPETTCHFGAFEGEEQVGVVTIYPAPLPERPEEPATWQLRGMAVKPGRQRSGIGRLLLSACLDHLRAAGARTLWCNARLVALDFYRKEGFQTLGEQFEIPTAGPHYRMWRGL